MRHNIFIIIFAFSLSGCYTINQEKFETYVSNNVTAGMSLSNASTYLKQDGFTCDSQSFKPIVSCTRSFNNFSTLQNCQERINFYPDQSYTNVEKVELMQIMCVGF